METITKELTVDFGICVMNDVLYPEAIRKSLIDAINVNPGAMPIVHSVSAVKHGFAIDTNAIIGAVKSAEALDDTKIKFVCDLVGALSTVELDNYQLTPIGIGVIRTIEDVPTYTTYRPLAYTFTPKTES